jgi:multidrug efflux pump
MLTATVLAIFLVPLFFVVILRLFKVKPSQQGDTAPDLALSER